MTPLLHCLHWLTTQKCYPEPFRWTPCCGDVLCWPYAYLILFFALYADQFAEKVGAMLYISSHLTFLMLAIVPPISLGAVGTCLDLRMYALTMVITRYSMVGT
jgi:hypothetical protein